MLYDRMLCLRLPDLDRVDDMVDLAVQFAEDVARPAALPAEGDAYAPGVEWSPAATEAETAPSWEQPPGTPPHVG